MSDLPALAADQPFAGTMSTQDDPSYRIMLITVRDDLLELADPRDHPANYHLWHLTAVALRSLIQLATGVDTTDTQRESVRLFGPAMRFL